MYGPKYGFYELKELSVRAAIAAHARDQPICRRLRSASELLTG